MDYTTVTNVKNALHIATTGDATLLATLVTAASRAIDRYCTGAITADAENYFMQATVTDETLRGRAAVDGVLHVFPHKPNVSAVSALAYRFSPLEDWLEIATDYIAVEGNHVMAWSVGSPGQPFIRISYTGGYSTLVTGLPADLVEAATLMAGRYYREEESGITDVIGVAELGQLIYTKAMPVRVKVMLAPFVRVVGW